MLVVILRSSATKNLSFPRTLAERFFPSLRFVQNDILLASFFKLNHYRRLVRLDKIRATVDIAADFLAGWVC